MDEYKSIGPTPVEPLKSTLVAPWNFLRPTKELHGAISGSAKHFFDSLATSVSGSQYSRLQNNRKRKRYETGQDPTDRILQLKQLYVDGFASDQVWEQAVRILDSTEDEIKRNHIHDQSLPPNARAPTVLRASPSSSIEEPEQNDVDDSIDDEAGQPTHSYDEDIDVKSSSEAENPPSDEVNGEDNPDEVFSEGSGPTQFDEESTHDTYKEDPFGLNDGFFSIDDFNAQSEAFENDDARGGPVEEVDSDDEEVDWHSNPLIPGNTVPISADSTSKNADGSENDEMSESSDDGPTFGDAKLQGESDSDEDNDEEAGIDAGGWIDTSNIKYADFFAPPPRKATAKKSRPLPKTQPATADVADDMNRAMTDVRRDLFENEPSDMDEDEDSSVDDTGGKNQRSTHERQRARITDEIRRLEASNVAKKEWMLSGEARAAERPINSLIEEELDFERIGKPVPVVTTELSESIEDLIKRRILAKDFDEISRRRPGATDAQDARKPRFELDDNKAQQGLAEMYEADHLRATDPNYVDPKNQKLATEHTEIKKLWKEVSDQLDTLSNWHYKPKAPQANINVVTDVATVMMEEARPNASGAISESAALAPQEIYAPGNDNKNTGEVVLKTGASVAKDEMTREEKGKLRRQQKKQKKANLGQSHQQSGNAAEKQQIVSDLKKGGVKVIGKQGEITNIHGGKTNGAHMKNSGDTLKL